MDDIKYFVGFSRVPGIGRVKFNQILEYFPNLEEAWNASNNELKNAGLDSRTITNIIHYRTRINLDYEIERMEKYKVKAISYLSPEYPSRLKEIVDYPPVLYIRGDILKQDELSIAVVGTRKATVYGRRVTEEIVGDLARNNITIVSGLAKGIDSIAHNAALEAGGRTIAVFACGLDMVYPSDNSELARRIMNQGALISEYPLGIRPKADNFPRRNRIMSGISLGILVVEAGKKSGSLITAEQALNQNREVFAIPGSIFSPLSYGTNTLIQSGAKLVRDYLDILEELNLAAIEQQIEMKEFTSTNNNEQILLQQLTTEPIHIDEICRLSGLSANIVGSTLAIMEIKGIVKQVGNMNFALTKNFR